MAGLIKQLFAMLVLCLCAIGAGAQDITLNLKNVDIGVLIDTVSEATGRNFIVDPRVKGTVTVISSTPINDTDLYLLFEEIMKVHGYATVESNGMVQIVPAQEARTDSKFSDSAEAVTGADNVITRVVAINNVDAAQLVPMLRPLVPQSGHLAAAPASNVLLITDRASNVEQLLKIIRRIDVAQDSGIEVVAMKHASAVEVVRVVSDLMNTSAEGGGEFAAGRAKLMADERTNSVLIRGDKETRLKLRGVVANMDRPKAFAGNTSVIYLRHSNAADLLGVLEGLVESWQAANDAASAAATRTSIQADASVNALIITAPPDITATLREVIDKLDVRRRQVLVEALIAEVSLDKAAELGVQWRSTQESSDEGVFGGTNFNLTNQGINRLSGQPGAAGDGLSLGFLDGTTTVLGTEILNLGALLRALAADSSTNILSTPSLVTLDNEEASIVVGQNVPFITGQFTATGATEGASNPFQTIERQDVGITLRVKPQINDGGAIRLELAQEVSSISPATTTNFASDIITDKRSINTTVLVDDGQIVVLGGLIEDDLQEDHQKVPLLGDVPLLGRLFRYDRTSKIKKNLMVFLTPTILKDASDHAKATGTRYGRLRGLQQQRQEQGVELMPDERQPTMEELPSSGTGP